MVQAIVALISEKVREWKKIATDIETYIQVGKDRGDLPKDVTFESVVAAEAGPASQKDQPTVLYMAQVILREEKHPLHSLEEMEKIARERHGWKVTKGSMGTQMHKSVKNGHGVFVKSKDRPNTYGLRDYNAPPVEIRALQASKRA